MTAENESVQKIVEQAAEHWNEATRAPTTAKTRWWKVPQVVSHVNRRVCGEPLNGFGAGLHHWVHAAVEDLPLGVGVAVGGGNGNKEMDLLAAGIVEHMHVYEIAEARVIQGRQLADDRGLGDQITFHHQLLDPSEAVGPFDLVHWNNALHHMLDVDAWLAWSRRVLRPDGVLLMDDFVGADRFQWPKRQLRLASRYRRALPERMLVNPSDPSLSISRKVTRPTLDAMMASDPTEAADSSHIVSSLERHFPGVEIRYTGGVIYSLALNDVVANFHPTDDSWLLKQALMMDDLISALGENHYAVAIGRAHAANPAVGAPHSMKSKLASAARHPSRIPPAIKRRLEAPRKALANRQA